jgi:hypothetical protein
MAVVTVMTVKTARNVMSPDTVPIPAPLEKYGLQRVNGICLRVYFCEDLKPRMIISPSLTISPSLQHSFTIVPGTIIEILTSTPSTIPVVRMEPGFLTLLAKKKKERNRAHDKGDNNENCDQSSLHRSISVTSWLNPTSH